MILLEVVSSRLDLPPLVSILSALLLFGVAAGIEGAFDRDLFDGGGVKKFRLRIFGLFFRFLHLSDEHPQLAPHDALPF